MPAITCWHWIGFIACVLVFLALDLGVFHRRAQVENSQAALFWTVVWFGVAVLFALALKSFRGPQEALEYLTGYLIEASLSLDNVFVMTLIFAYFAIPAQLQHRVLFWGVIGAMIMRGALIGAGLALVSRLGAVLYIFGAFLLFSGIKLLIVKNPVQPEKNKIVQLARRFCTVSPNLDGQKFTTIWQGKRALTPLALVLLTIETSDLIFGLDSIPAVFSVTTKPFIVFTSNIFAILGLRSLYFVVAGAVRSFRYMRIGISVVLVFFGTKMLLAPHEQPPRWFQVQIPTSVSLMTVAAIILITIVLSLAVQHRENRSQRQHNEGESKPNDPGRSLPREP
jgi:tellurite resistance protein TerC